MVLIMPNISNSYNINKYPDAPSSAAYLKTTSDILNGLEVSLFRFCTKTEIQDIQASTVSIDLSAAMQLAVDACLTPQRAASLIIPGRCWIDESINIDRMVDSTYSEFIIKGQGAGAGFYTTGAVTIFDSTLVVTTDPLSEWICFQDLQFETSSIFNATWVLSKKFLRIKNQNCNYRLIRYMNANDIYVQSHHFSACNIRNTPGNFLDAHGLYDVSFSEKCIIENGNTLVSCIDTGGRGCNGLRVINNVIEGLQDKTLKLTGLSGFIYADNHVESNPANDIDTSLGVMPNFDVTISGRYVYNPSGALVKHGVTDKVDSRGTSFSGTILHTGVANVTNFRSFDSPISGGDIADVPLYDLGGGVLSNKKMNTPFVGVGSNTSAWADVLSNAVQMPSGVFMTGQNALDTAGFIGYNAYFNSSAVWKRVQDNAAAYILLYQGGYTFKTAASDFAGTTITWTDAMNLSVDGVLTLLGNLRSNSNGTSTLGVASVGWKGLYLDYTNTATVGAVTINKPSGRVNVAASATSITVTNSLVTAASHVFAVCSTADATARVTSIVPSAGSFTILLVAATAQASIDFLLINAD